VAVYYLLDHAVCLHRFLRQTTLYIGCAHVEKAAVDAAGETDQKPDDKADITI